MQWRLCAPSAKVDSNFPAEVVQSCTTLLSVVQCCTMLYNIAQRCTKLHNDATIAFAPESTCRFPCCVFHSSFDKYKYQTMKIRVSWVEQLTTLVPTIGWAPHDWNYPIKCFYKIQICKILVSFLDNQCVPFCILRVALNPGSGIQSGPMLQGSQESADQCQWPGRRPVSMELALNWSDSCQIGGLGNLTNTQTT